MQRFEHYELVRGEDGKPVELGRGAMGVTYKAFDVDLHCPVTLKVISERYLGDESARLRFLREARAAARLRHSNVASVLHLGRTGSSYFYAMEFVEEPGVPTLTGNPATVFPPPCYARASAAVSNGSTEKGRYSGNETPLPTLQCLADSS